LYTKPGKRNKNNSMANRSTASRGQKLANWDSASPKQKKSNSRSINSRSNRSNHSNRSNNSRSNRSSADDSSSDSDELSMSESESDANAEDDDDLANVDDVAAAMRKRTNAGMSFSRDWEDVYLADELRAQAHKRDPSKSDDGMPSEMVLLILVVTFATTIGLIAHYLLRLNGYHDLGHEDIMEGEL